MSKSCAEVNAVRCCRWGKMSLLRWDIVDCVMVKYI